MPGPLPAGELLVRELHAADAADMARLAESRGYLWGQLLPVPASESEATHLITHWVTLRAAGTGNLLGFYTPDGRLIVALCLLTDEFTAQFAGWGTTQPAERKLVVSSLAYFLRYLHDSVGLVQISIDVQEHDRYTDFLVHNVGLHKMGTVTGPDGTTRERLSFI